MPYLRNCWYLAAWSSELQADGVLGRTLLDIPVALFRDGDGGVVAILDRCPHRFAPLSLGKSIDGALQCLYHGLRFGAGGKCVLNPYGAVPSGLRIPDFPAVERHRGVWVWMGDPDRADAEAIPDLGYLNDYPETAFSSGYLKANAGYQLFVDNIMDLTHTEYLHASTLAGGFVDKIQPIVEDIGACIEVTWLAPDREPLPLVQRLHPEIERADILTRTSWMPPSVMKITAGTLPVGSTEADGLVNYNAHVMTPETETSTHYFFAATRNYRTDDVTLTESIANARQTIFETEDKPMIEHVQSRMGDQSFWDLRPIHLGAEGAAVRARRRLERMIREEASTAPPAE